jgi:hypothetical protein
MLRSVRLCRCSFAASLPRRYIAQAAGAIGNLALFEVNVNWAIPASATVFQAPDLCNWRCPTTSGPPP